LAYVAASVREAGHDVALIDALGENTENVYHFRDNLYVNGLTIPEILAAIPPDTEFIGVSLAFSHEWPLSRQVCVAIAERFPKAVMIVGGEHATAMAEFCLSDCTQIDYVILGEGEETIVALIDALEKGLDLKDVDGLCFRDGSAGTLRTSGRARIRDIDKISAPAWDLVPLENYLSRGYSFGVNIGRTIPILATRGCPYQCTFCSNPQMWTTRWIPRDAASVVAEIEKYIHEYRIDNIDFYDLTVVVKHSWIIEFCNLLIEKNLGITWQLPSGTRSEALDDVTTALMQRSGCRNLSYAPESGSPETLEIIKKKIKPSRMIESVKSSIANGMNVKANIIIGFPKERWKNILETYGFIVRLAFAGLHDLSVWTFSPYPGSELFDDLRREGRIPEYTDDYFTSLLSYSDLKNVRSWNLRFSDSRLKAMRLFGMVLFYSSSYLFRPYRLLRNIRNILSHKPESRLEMIVETALSRHKKNLAEAKTKTSRWFKFQ
jgi:radical SAM superfamily enzyme YgiQ (UPF0313 family)